MLLILFALAICFSQEKKIYVVNPAIEMTYPIVHTGVTSFYSATAEISKPQKGKEYYGQDAHYQFNMPSYTDNGNGTVTDNITGLMWQKDMGEKMTLQEALEKVKKRSLGGYNDWRVPTIKELYSLIQFTGQSLGERLKTPFIDTMYFYQPVGDISIGEREIDAQTFSCTEYTGRTMNGNQTVFGVNFIDGRIKGYPKNKKMYIRLVRGNENYGINNFVDNGDGTVTDLATGLTWQKADSGVGMNWKDALAYAEDLELAGKSDWRLPSAKELHSIVDYTRSLQATNSPAIDPVFICSSIVTPDGKKNYPYYWTSTSHLDGQKPYRNAVYIAFGEALGQMNGKIMDVHGAGAQRSDPKEGTPNNYPAYLGPQGDMRVVFNYVRCVR